MGIRTCRGKRKHNAAAVLLVLRTVIVFDRITSSGVAVVSVVRFVVVGLVLMFPFLIQVHEVEGQSRQPVNVAHSKMSQSAQISRKIYS